jgi:serine/threonine-protein kinase
LQGQGRYGTTEALRILEPIAIVLDEAHARGVVHRDLEPENVMVEGGADDRLFVKVIDPGIAELEDLPDATALSTSMLTGPGQVRGTPYCISPEQWGEAPRDDGRPEIDGGAEVYSLGVIAFELLTGRRPFDGRTIEELRRAHLSAPPASSRAGWRRRRRRGCART